ncbi:TIGR04028 family ABC transporter substrate-binding protein [Ketogulonicigenium vulgare]|uniref:ABC transporter substrate-binding protein (Oligopeptide) n=1 Tax=Ketogulonicigenium vulgare (strain WSH-001) TaxID=759362 RepID=F9Y6G0_KETVW|nr:TIGR04028 family ABC transporter substrate-binding protein [Ketogulonicigenium vulgare]ADO42712.1 ABC transporter substrate binding protein (oligopeptide) [Ketogulonicigenium vulgare Y25]AEM40906.1 ABC transporter substrate-binding protein (Oligopeptide) [Ketogulonicigenium vulgare WSH-001]ALJ81060.1 ABC transporter substrate-binding protein [Ketogulonicigenium vulgare]ANW33815.1 ABC transporter substrate binding protein [Ketogulonicigenium vulgare]AOZ54624.1 putative binding protein yliB p
MSLKTLSLTRRTFGWIATSLLLSSTASIAFGQEAGTFGGTLTYLEQQPHTVLYPPAGGFYPNGGILNQITDKLTYQNPETLVIEPWIAESWEINDTYTEFTFHLRDGVTFSDGTPVDAAAVARNYDVYGLGDPTRRFPISEVLNNYQSSEVIDPLTVRFHFSAPSAGFLQGTSVIGSGLVSLATLDRAFDALGDATLIIGSGPFVVESQTTGTELVLKVREDYNWGPALHPHQGRAYLDEIRYIIVPEDGVRIGALLSGQADFVRQIQAYDEGQVTARGYQLYAPSTRGVNNQLTFRPDNDLVSDINVRRALTLATDRREIVDTLYSANYPLATSVIASTAQGYIDLSDQLEYNQEEAIALLEAAGWHLNANGRREKDGVVFELTAYESLPQPQNRAALQLISQQWDRIGITLNVLAGDAGTAVQDNLDPQRTGVGPAMVGRADPDVIKSQYYPRNRNALLQTGGVSDKVRNFHDDQLNGLLEAIAAETDPDQRLSLVADVQRYILDQSYTIPIFEEPQVFGGAPYVHGVGFEAVGRPSFYATYIQR